MADQIESYEHQWVKNKAFEKEKLSGDVFYTEKYICSVCGCRRMLVESEGYRKYSYYRSLISFSSEPECIDWEEIKHNDKID